VRCLCLPEHVQSEEHEPSETREKQTAPLPDLLTRETGTGEDRAQGRERDRTEPEKVILRKDETKCN